MAEYYRHRNAQDAFVKVRDVTDLAGEKTLLVQWMVQGVDKYWEARDRATGNQVLTHLTLKANQTEWERYEPRGTYC